MIPPSDVDRIERWIAQKNASMPEHVRDRMSLGFSVEGHRITIIDHWLSDPDVERAVWIDEEVARLRFVERRGQWSLYWPDRNSDFHESTFLRPTRHVQRLPDEIDQDPTAIFWG